MFVWSMLVFSFMAIFAVPAVTLATGLNELDRLFRHIVLRAPACDDGPDPRGDPHWYDDGDEDADEDEPGSFG